MCHSLDQNWRLAPNSILYFNPESPFDFGPVNYSDAFIQTFQVGNEGPYGVHIDSIDIVGRDHIDFFIYTDHCTDSDLPVDSFLDFSVVFKPVSPFEKEATVVLYYNTVYSVLLYLNGFGITPRIDVPAQLYFGNVELGSSLVQDLIIKNTGNADLEASLKIYDDPEEFVVEGSPWGNIAPNRSMVFPIRFTPASGGIKTATAVISSNDPYTGGSTVRLAGICQAPDIAVAPPSKAFPDTPVDRQSPTQLFTVSNVNSAPLIIGTLAKGGNNPQEFVIMSDLCSGRTLNHGQSCTFEVAFSPSAAGNRQATIIIPSNDPDSPLEVSVSGRGTVARLYVTPTVKVFDDTSIGSASPPQTFTVQNTGTADLVLGAIQFEGQDTVHFIKQNDSCSDSTFTPGTAGTFQVLFRPTSPGLKVIQISIPSNDPDLAQVKPEVSGIGVAPDILVTPDECNFGNVLSGSASAPQEFTVIDTGTADLAVSSIVIQGANASEFVKQSDHCTGRPIARGTSAVFQIVFTPNSAGSKNATAVIHSNAPESPAVSVPLAGTGQTHPVIVTSPTFKNFGDVTLGSSSPLQLFRVTNSNTMPLLIGILSKVGSNPGDFSIRNDFCSGRTLAHGESATFELMFSPLSAGEKQAAVNVPSNDPDTPDLMIPVNGRGTAPSILVQPAEKNFGEIRKGSYSTLQTFTLQNRGTADLSVGDITISGANAEDFLKGNDGCSWNTFAPGLFDMFQVVFRPATADLESAQVNIPSNDPVTPDISIPLSGKGFIEDITSEPAVKNYPPVTPGSEPVFQTFWVTNNAKYAVRTGRAYLTAVQASSAPAEEASPQEAGIARSVSCRSENTDFNAIPLNISSAGFRAGDTDQFIIRNDQVSDRTLQPNESASLEAAFAPTRAGTFRAFVNIPTDDPILPLFKIVLLGTAPVGPRIVVTPFTANLGEIYVGGRSAAFRFTVSSVGSSNLFISNVIVTGQDFGMFRKTDDSCSGRSLPYGGDASFDIFFAPSSRGCKTATVSIYSNDLVIPVNTIWLYGKGV